MRIATVAGVRLRVASTTTQFQWKVTVPMRLWFGRKGTADPFSMENVVELFHILADADSLATECRLRLLCTCEPSTKTLIYGSDEYASRILRDFLSKHDGHDFLIHEWPDRKEARAPIDK